MRAEDIEIKMERAHPTMMNFWIGRLGQMSFLFPRDNKATSLNKMRKIKKLLTELCVYENDRT